MLRRSFQLERLEKKPTTRPEEGVSNPIRNQSTRCNLPEGLAHEMLTILAHIDATTERAYNLIMATERAYNLITATERAYNLIMATERAYNLIVATERSVNTKTETIRNFRGFKYL